MNIQASNPINDAYRRDGFHFPCKAMEASEAATYRARLEAWEKANGRPLKSAMRTDVHLLFTWADELVRHPRILDAVECVIGPNILCWITNFFIKEPGDGNFVSWHQDATYWGLEPHDQVLTAWLALSEASVRSGAMKFLPGSHRHGLHDHVDTFARDNLLSRGQEIQLEVDEARATDIVLKAGEFSLHHVLTAHGSHPNVTDDRRIGLAIRYIPTTVRQTKVRDTAVLVRGVDEHGHFDLLEGPDADMSEKALAVHKDANERLVKALLADTGQTRLRD